MQSPYSAAAIANFFIRKNKVQSAELTHLKLQKLLFFAQGWFMANYSIPLFEETFEAWRHGPVVRSIYNTLSGSGSSIIDTEINQVFADEGGTPKYGAPQVEPGDAIAHGFLEEFWKLYHPIHAFRLSEMSHTPGSPWHRVYTTYGGYLPFGAEIDDRDIRDYFSKLREDQARRQG